MNPLGHSHLESFLSTLLFLEADISTDVVSLRVKVLPTKIETKSLSIHIISQSRYEHRLYSFLKNKYCRPTVKNIFTSEKIL